MCSHVPGGRGQGGRLQWLALVALFAAALATLAVYLVQYVRIAWRRRAGSPRPPPPADSDPLLAWVLARGSWRSQWRGAWTSALNAAARARTVREQPGGGAGRGGLLPPGGLGSLTGVRSVIVRDKAARL